MKGVEQRRNKVFKEIVEGKARLTYEGMDDQEGRAVEKTEARSTARKSPPGRRLRSTASKNSRMDG